MKVTAIIKEGYTVIIEDTPESINVYWANTPVSKFQKPIFKFWDIVKMFVK